MTTGDLARESGQSAPFYDPRPAFKELFGELYPEGLDGRSVIDCACNNGAHLFALKELGAGECFGSDVRKRWIDQARFLVQHRQGPTEDMNFQVADLYALEESDLAPVDIGVFAGVFYHLPDPIRGLQIVANLTKELLYVSTATCADQPDDRLVAIRESTELELSGVHGLAFYPTGPNVIKRMLTWLGYPAIRCVDWWNPSDSDPELDSMQMVAAREKRFLERFDSRRPPGTAGMLRHIRETIRPRSRIAMACLDEGDAVDVPDRQVLEFPARLDSSDAHSAALEELRAAGAEYLVVPRDAFGWLDRNSEFRSYLDLHYTAVRDPDSCILYDLRS